MNQNSKKSHYQIKLEKTKKLKSDKKKKRLRQSAKPEISAGYVIDLSFCRRLVSPAAVFILIISFFLLSPFDRIVNPLACAADSDNGVSNGLVYDYFSDNPYTSTGPEKRIIYNTALYDDILPILDKTPMKAMIEEIATRDRAVAAYLVGIAMKESKFGLYSPKKNGRDCYNYWGYRGRENPTASGYSCFKDEAQAIDIVGGRIESMIKNKPRTPAQMISWKCGSSCAGHSQESVNKWIKDVSIYYYQLNPVKEIVKK